MPMRLPALLSIIAAAFAATAAFAQSKPRLFYLPRPLAPDPYHAPMKPIVRLADLEEKHRLEQLERTGHPR